MARIIHEPACVLASVVVVRLAGSSTTSGQAENVKRRGSCRIAAKEYRGDGIVDTIPTIRQHRRNAQWLWW
jgi:hypothetical protein